MNFKDKLVSKLLDIGKKHRILVYPMLALVAVVTAISHVICWGRGWQEDGRINYGCGTSDHAVAFPDVIRCK